MIDYFLADDLSGALDAAAAFHHVGRRVRIVLSAESWTAQPDDEVVGVTTETRNVSAACASAAVIRALEHASGQGARLVYKKIDSTLRGPVAAELEALARALPDARILFAPANPAAGRVVRDGVLLVHGVPVGETEFGRDPGCPVRESEVRAFLGPLAAERVAVPNVETPEDLDAAVAAIARTADAWVGMGSGALARPVAVAISGDAAAFARPGNAATTVDTIMREALPRELLMVSGSAHPLNRVQAGVLARDVGIAVRELRLATACEAVRGACSDLAHQRAAIVLVEGHRHERVAVLRAITDAVEQIVTEAGVRRIFVTGGETASALCTRLSATSLIFEVEIEPGLTLSRATTHIGDMLLAVKPGGFGDVDTWCRAWRGLLGDCRRGPRC